MIFIELNLRMTEEEIVAEESAKKANIVSNQEFNILTKRVETMEQSIGNIVEKVEKFLAKVLCYLCLLKMLYFICFKD